MYSGAVRVAADGKTSPFFMAQDYSVAYRPHIRTRSSVDDTWDVSVACRKECCSEQGVHISFGGHFKLTVYFEVNTDSGTLVRNDRAPARPLSGLRSFLTPAPHPEN